ncbi:TULIP family P47-like protein [Microbispora sp. NPDC049125]|uniref:TULIP family P47-like protein n=1 Tax=Microbispora sp. NPDC049125 TaxID=3154929 RepID=UPI003467D046
MDRVAALPVDTLNAMLAERREELVTAFSFSGETLGTPYSGSGTLDAWRILPGEPGDLLRLALPIASGSVTAGEGGAIDLTGLDAVVMVALRLLPGEEGLPPGGNPLHREEDELPAGEEASRGERPGDLVFDLREAGRLGDDAVPGVVTPVALTGPGRVLAELSDLGRRAVLDGVAGPLARHAAELSFVLATVDLGARPAPRRSAFNYTRTTGRTDSGYLAVFGVMEDVDVSRLPLTLDPALASGGEAVFAVSSRLFLTEMVLPGLPDALGGETSAATVAYDPASKSLRETRPFSIGSLVEGAIRYTPRVTSLSIGVVGGDLAVRVEGDCDLKAGISMTFWATARSRMVFHRDRAAISFVPDGKVDSGYQADIPVWFILGGPLAEGITQLVVSVISEDLAGRLGSGAGPAGLGRWASRPVRWGAARAMTVEHAALDGCFHISGRPA